MNVTLEAKSLILQMYMMFHTVGYDFEDLCNMRMLEIINEDEDAPSPAKMQL